MISNTYVIVPTNEITDSMIDESSNDSNSLRYNNDKTKVILKFNTQFPDIMQGYKKYTHIEILEQLTNVEWINE